jgi:hypothetical protein
MKNTRKFICLAVIAAIGFAALSLTGCPNEDKFETVATPTATPGAGPVTGSQTVTLTCATPGAKIIYTLDGSDPAKNNTANNNYSGPIPNITPPKTIKAIAVKKGMLDSAIMEAVYTLPPEQMPTTDVTQLTVNTWADGNLPASNSEQWFKFTATTTGSQYIHVVFGTLSSSQGLYVQVYNSSGVKVEDKQQLYGYTSRSASRNLTPGQEYYIKVWPYSSSFTGTYKIAFNTSSSSDSIIEMVPAEGVTELTENIWADGNFTTSNPEQWFKFKATVSIQYIHAAFGTLSSSNGLYVQVYDSKNVKVGDETNLWSSSTSTSRAVIVNQEYYYIKVRPYNSSYTGTYQVAFNKSSMAPSLTITLPSDATVLTENTWADGNLTTSSSEQWFKFTAATSTNYQYIHISFDTLNSNDGVNVQVYEPSGDKNENEVRLYGTGIYRYMYRGVTASLEYYIRVRPDTSAGTYKIAINASSIAPSP